MSIAGISNDLRAKGIDLSGWNKVSDWSALRQSDISFVGLKATEGNTVVDRSFQSVQTACRSSSFDLIIYYHFARSGPPEAQANRFINVVGSLSNNERLALDFEVATTDPASDGIKWIDSFISVVMKAYPDRRPILYTSQRIWRMIGEPDWARAASVDLWSPRYNSLGNEPELPTPWKTVGWTFWQWSDGTNPPHQTPGVGACDANYFKGTRADLGEYVKLLPVTT